MARLNEPPMSADSFEILRKKLLRQNRDLAKLNNIRALRIRELENDCACMLSENVGLRARIAELEKQVENNETRRIADHAMAIKEKLEAQLTEWGTLIAGLGLEPPPKRHSPAILKKTKRRTSFDFQRTSPSQRRLRDVAKDIEELGHISEHKSYSRRSMNPDQIRALRSEVDTDDPPALQPPMRPRPIIEDEPVKPGSPVASPIRSPERSLVNNIAPPETLLSPKPSLNLQQSPSPSPRKKKGNMFAQPCKPEARTAEPQKDMSMEAPKASSMPAATPTKAGVKRKLASRDEPLVTKTLASRSNENQPLRVLNGKTSIRDQTGGKTLKELSNIRKEEQPTAQLNRRPLSTKSTNDDIASPKKKSRKSTVDEVVAAKEMVKPKSGLGRAKGKTKLSAPALVEIPIEPESAQPMGTVRSELGTPLAEPELLAPNSPMSAPSAEGARGDTPPPADISSNGETSRASRRSRGVVSYAEPNLRDKMRRPTKDMVDAVTGSRRSSQFELLIQEPIRIKRESSSGPSSESKRAAPEPGSIPMSPLAGKAITEELPSSVATERRKRPSTMIKQEPLDDEEDDIIQDETTESFPSSDGDLYDFKSTSPSASKQSKRKSTSRQAKSSRRFSAALENDDPYSPNERNISRRRSMLV